MALRTFSHLVCTIKHQHVCQCDCTYLFHLAAPYSFVTVTQSFVVQSP